MHIIQAEIGTPKIGATNVGDNHTLFTVAPLPAGFGMTLGNSFRRVLLSSLPGAAVTAVKVKGATHEYETLAGVEDSLLDIILNLKQLAIHMDGKGPAKMTLETKGGGEVTAKDIQHGSELEILNPELVLTTLDKKGNLSMEITVEKGVGYEPAAERQAKNREAGLIMIDANFSPVRRVRYDVSAQRVGDRTNLDKLEMEVMTNGSMSPEEAVKFASDILTNYFTLFGQDHEDVETDFIADASKMQGSAAVADHAPVAIGGGEVATAQEKYTPIEILGFSPRTLNALINGGIGSIEQLVKCTPSRIAGLRGFGAKALDEVADKLAERDLKLTDED